MLPAETEGQLIYELGYGQWNIAELRRLLEEIIPQNNSFDGYVIEHDFPEMGRRVMRLNARRMPATAEGDAPLILLAIDDVTNS